MCVCKRERELYPHFDLKGLKERKREREREREEEWAVWGEAAVT